MNAKLRCLIAAIALALAAGCSSAPGGGTSVLPGNVHPFALQSNAPSPWQTEPDLGPPIIGSDGKSIWGFADNPFGAVRLDIASNTTQTFPISGSVFEGHAGPGGSFSFCGQGQVGSVSSVGVVTYFAEPIGRCFGVTTGPDNNMWLTEATSVDRITSTGQLTTFSMPVVALGPIVSSAKDGLLWFAWVSSAAVGVGSINPASGQSSLFPISKSLGGIGGAGLTTGVDGNVYYVPVLDRRSTGEIFRVTPTGAVKRFTNLPINLGYNNSAENAFTVWFGGMNGHLYAWATQSHRLTDKGASPIGVQYPILGPDMNVWLEGGVYLQRLLTVAPQSATLQAGSQQVFSITETDCSQCLWSAQSSNPGIASVSPVSSGTFTVTGVSGGSTSISVSDQRNNVVRVPITVN